MGSTSMVIYHVVHMSLSGSQVFSILQEAINFVFVFERGKKGYGLLDCNNRRDGHIKGEKHELSQVGSMERWCRPAAHGGAELYFIYQSAIKNS